MELVTTPYMVFAADDDFMLHDALTESVGFSKRIQTMAVPWLLPDVPDSGQ